MTRVKYLTTKDSSTQDEIISNKKNISWIDSIVADSLFADFMRISPQNFIINHLRSAGSEYMYKSL